MRFLIRTILSAISLATLFYSITQLAEYWDYEQMPANVSQLMPQKVSAQQIEQALITSLQEQRIDDAIMYLDIAQYHRYPIDYPHYQSLIAQHNTPAAQLKRKTLQFTRGFIQGKSTTSAGIAGAMTADFTVVGDIRDLSEQYQRSQNNQPVNELIVSLAGAGIGLTVLTYGTAGATSVVKAGTSTIKLAAKTKRLTKGFSQEILQQSQRVFNWRLFKQNLKQGNSYNHIHRAANTAFNPKALKPLKNSAQQLYKIKKSTNIADTLHLLRYVENSNDLRRLQKFTHKHGKRSKGYLTLLGKGVLRGSRVLKKTAGFILSALSTLLSFFFSVIFLFSYQRKQAIDSTATQSH